MSILIIQTLSNKVSIVIRNRNEAPALKQVLTFLTTLYAEDIEEIILVDNKSTDKSVEVAREFGCKILNIDKFTYGRAINLGIKAAAAKYVLLLSSHSVPVGNHFFKNSLEAIDKNPKVGGIRYINSFENYTRAFKNNFKVVDPVSFGLVAACCLLRRSVWEIFKFDENLVFAEDKDWSRRIVENGFEILDLNETFFLLHKTGSKGSFGEI